MCPVCRARLELRPGVVRCVRGHGFDVAKQGYVSLLLGSQAPGTADSPAMVAARASFLATGLYAPLAHAIAETVAALAQQRGRAVVVDAGVGTGYYLAAVLDEVDGAAGVAFDVSKHAVRRAARAHGRIGAFVADVWRPLPIADEVADVVLNVFAPRNGPEFARILRPGGALVVVTPAKDHLSPLVAELGLLSVDEDKERRVAESLRDFAEIERRAVEFEMMLTHDQITEVVGMGPSAWHSDAQQQATRIAKFPRQTLAKASFHLSIFKVDPRSRPLP
ncbi:putative RNA methyltransferase [Nonomuraea sp. NPDC046570]|uniref:putative RNA methyltransferase n=1 Tax=Nonomuraea sp. NPDC046570 TaxID=3155255 RepID=UPI0033CDB6B5